MDVPGQRGRYGDGRAHTDARCDSLVAPLWRIVTRNSAAKIAGNLGVFRASRWARNWHAGCKGARLTMKRFVLVSATFLALACSSQRPANDPGPAQRAGAKVDEGAESAKESAKKAGDKVGDATEKAGDKLKGKSDD